MTVAVFGPMVTGSDVEKAVRDTIRYWLPTYLAEMERRTSRPAGRLQLIRSWATVGASFDQPHGSDDMPAAIIVSPGTVDTPHIDGDDQVHAWFGCSIAILIQGSDRENANELAKLYAACVRQIFLDRGRLGTYNAAGTVYTAGFASATEWVGEANGELTADFMQAAWGTETEVYVLVEGVARRFAGPALPDLNPSDPGEVETVHIQISEETP